MIIFGLHIIDLLIVVTSLLAIIGVGLRASRGVKQGSDFFVGGRSIGGFLQFFLNFGMMTDSNGAPTIASEVYRQGVGGMWIGFQTLFLTPFYWFSSIWFRRARLVTGADLFVDRFNSRRLASLFAGITVLTLILQLAMGNVVSYKVASAMIVKPESSYTPADRQALADFHEYKRLKTLFAAGTLPQNQQERYQELDSRSKRGELHSYISYVQQVPFYVVYTLIVGTYVLLGGLKAAAITDAVQGILIIILSVIMVPVGLIKIGGLHALHTIVPEYNFRLFGTEAVSEYTWYSILAMVFTSLVTVPMPGGNASANASAKDETAVRTGVITGAFAKRLITIAWMFSGLLAIGLFVRTGISDPDNAWGTLSFSLLGPGLLGIMISGMLLGHMPAVGGNAVNISALVSRNLYEPLRPGRSQEHYLLMAKISIVITLVAGVLMGMFFSGVITVFTTAITFNAFFGAVGFLLFFWRKLTGRAIEWGIIVWVVMMAIVPWMLPSLTSFRRLPQLLVETPPRAVRVVSPATADDVSAGRAASIGQGIEKTRVLSPSAVYFESVARSDPADPASPREGIGRFHIEIFVLSALGFPVTRLNAAGLLTARWLFDGTFPYAMLIPFSYLTGRRRSGPRLSAPQQDVLADRLAEDRGHGDAETRAVAAVEALPIVGEEDEDLRIARFYAKMKTPVAPSRDLDEAEVAASLERPDRFDHLKLFPRSNWEFTRWSRSDTLGFCACWGAVLVMLGILWLAVTIGS